MASRLPGAATVGSTPCITAQARYISVQGGQLQATARQIRKEHLDVMFMFRSVVSTSHWDQGLAKAGDLLVSGTPSSVIVLFSLWRISQLRSIATGHGIGGREKLSYENLLEVLGKHTCGPRCRKSEYLFRILKHPRTVQSLRPAARAPEVSGDRSSIPDTSGAPQGQDDVPDHAHAPAEEDTGPPGENGIDDVSYLDIADDNLRRAIISEWEQAMSTVMLKEDVCAVCGRRTPPNDILFVKAARIRFELLRNEDLLDEIQPTSYNRAAYDGAILHPKGLEHPERRGSIKTCKECRKDLCDRQEPMMPRFALANWLYYGHDRLPEPAKSAFSNSTQPERTLVARARSSKVSFKFSELEGHPMYGSDPRVSQRCIKGNVAIHPQDAAHLTDVLPPSNDAVRDTLCAIFVGKKQPTAEHIRKLSPVLVRKSRVKTMIDFLLVKNPKYAVNGTFQGYSQGNMDALFDADAGGHRDEDVLCAMEIGHIQASDAVAAATEGYVPGTTPDSQAEVPGDDMLIENVGYTDSEDTLAVNPRDMAAEAMAHCVSHRRFIKSQAGSRFIPDFKNSSLLSWLFPHLDPWGIGGFFDERRQRPLSLDQQLKYLLQVEGSPFCQDPNFAFVYYNIRQKKAVFDSVTFQVPAAQRDRVIGEIMELNVEHLDSLAESLKLDPRYKPSSDEERHVMRVLSKVNAVSHDLPGSNGYKIRLRNQIRGLMHSEGTPTLFITLNPSDRDHPLVRLYAGHEIVLEDHMRGEELTRWQRTKIVARNPSACASTLR